MSNEHPAVTDNKNSMANAMAGKIVYNLKFNCGLG